MLATVRRPRTARISVGKRLALGARDCAVFGLLDRYRYLRSTYLHAFCGGVSSKRFVERLGDLFHEGYLDRPEQQWQVPDARCRPAVYALGAKGRRALDALGGGKADAVTYLGPTAHRQFAHALTICDVLASIELGARSAPSLAFISWGQVLGRAPETTRRLAKPFALPVCGYRDSLVPDGVFGLAYRAGGTSLYRFFALEIDRGTMPVSRSAQNGQSSFAAKVDAYGHVIAHRLHSTHWGFSRLLVLTLTSNAARLQTMLTCVEAGAPEPSAFLFKTMTDAQVANGLVRPDIALLTDPWRRPRAPPLGIAVP